MSLSLQLSLVLVQVLVLVLVLVGLVLVLVLALHVQSLLTSLHHSSFVTSCVDPFSWGVKYTGWVGKNLRFPTEIAVYLGNGSRLAHGCYVMLIGSRRVGSDDLN